MPFPVTSLLDDFNRADDPTSLGASWTSPILGAFGSLGILSNQCYADAAFEANYWNTLYSEAQEAWVTLSTLPAASTCRLCCRIQNPNSANTNEYYLLIDDTGAARFTKDLNEVQSDIKAVVGNGVPVYQAGDKVGIRADGSTIEAWRDRTGWELLDSATDTSITGGGYIGLTISNDTATRFDDFGGGSLFGPTLRSQYLDYDYSRS